MIDEQQYIEDADRLYYAGYRAASREECPYPVASSGPHVIWMQGFYARQADRKRVAAAAADPWCRHPLGPSI